VGLVEVEILVPLRLLQVLMGHEVEWVVLVVLDRSTTKVQELREPLAAQAQTES